MTTPQQGPGVGDEPTIGRLIADTSRDLSALIRGEIELAKTELRFSVKAGGIGIALFAAAAFILILAIIMLSIAFAFFFHWLYFGVAVSFLLVFAVYLLLGALLAYIGVRKIKQVRAPEQTIAAVKSNKQVLKRG
jgi:uncharacterized membrane protein YqjE